MKKEESQVPEIGDSLVIEPASSSAECINAIRGNTSIKLVTLSMH